MSDADCLACHSDPELLGADVDGNQIKVYVAQEVLKDSVHQAFSCTDCHTDVKSAPHEPLPQKVACDTCHADVGAEFHESVHSQARSRGDRDAATCSDCHGSHDVFAKDDVRSRVNRLNIPDTCSKCHADQNITQRHALPSPNFIKQYRESVHGRRIAIGLRMSAVCSDCHTAHAIKAAGDPASTVSKANAPGTCSTCHADVFHDFQNGAHGRLWKNSDDRGPVCTTCHSAHQIARPSTIAFRLNIPLECGKCHESRAPTYRDTFHGQATSLGYAQAAKCSDCHTPHSNLPKDDPLSTVNSANLIQTCGKCHPGANAKFVSYDPHPEPANKQRSLLLYGVSKFMKWLFIAVFGFFGVHTLLWLQRSIAAVVCKEVHRFGEGEEWVVRFAAPHRVTHLVMVVSFLGLAATGLPLIYHDTSWGRALASVLGGVEVSRYFHRLWAIATFGYAVYHLGYLLKRLLIKRDLSVFKGPESLMPRRRDFADLWGMISWFFYLGPRPKLDRWTYWEKFDYFAVFWGIPIIAFSGLMLWLPRVFTTLLGGEWLNVAMIVHGEEALLAVGFIFAFHFFHNHMRPESFPLDTVMFTGKMPLEKFRTERAAEYERILAEGRLESIIVGPPSRLAAGLSRWFGCAALAVGVILVLAIFWTFLFR